MFGNFQKLLAEFSDFQVSENFRKIDITVSQKRVNKCMVLLSGQFITISSGFQTKADNFGSTKMGSGDSSKSQIQLLVG